MIQIGKGLSMIFSENLFQEILTLKDYFDTYLFLIYIQYVYYLVLFLNWKEKTFSNEDHSQFYRTLTSKLTSFSDERFNLHNN